MTPPIDVAFGYSVVVVAVGIMRYAHYACEIPRGAAVYRNVFADVDVGVAHSVILLLLHWH